MKSKTRLTLVSLIALLFAFSLPAISVSAYSSNQSVHLATLSAAPTSALSITKTTCADCFAGYSDLNSAANGTITSVSVSITVPTVKCNSKGLQLSEWGVFLDVYYTNDFNSAAVVAQCYNGQLTYYGFVENATAAFTTVWSPAPRDNVKVSIVESSRLFHFTINDVTQGQTATLVTKVPKKAALDSAICGSDMFYNTLTLKSDPSVKFSTVPFTNCLVDGKAIGTAPGGSVYEFTSVNGAGTKTLAEPSALAKNENFKVTWKSNGP
jgi:hypothetical protein